MLSADIAGIGFWARGLPSWKAACMYVRDGQLHQDAPAKPAPQLLAANERRRAPETVAVALEVALAACEDAGKNPADLPSVFASMHGDLAITDYMCQTLTEDARALSPTKFHNSVHNAAAGYWTIGVGCTQPATALSSGDATFALGLLEALAQLASGDAAVLLAAYDSQATGPLATMSPSDGLLGGALVLARPGDAALARLQVEFVDAPAPQVPGRLAAYVRGNAMSP
ncbi:MAG: beta-ketoacyl synthase chain length factor, partial [Pseudomonadota bacterium]|nr:beta-ketoacyl synthase chain length factor [Pseudomonadota bacterium]MDQ3160259.1 beta-ketoacyl synthase chain length factor [Pseudomonadota bacterium]